MKMLLRSSAALLLAACSLLPGSSQAGDKKDIKTDEKKDSPPMEFRASDEFTNADLKDKVRTEMFSKTYAHKMTEGRTYQIDLKGANNMDTYLRLENADGEQLAEDDDSGGGLDARIVFRAPKTGEFTIVCTTFAPGTMGKFTLIVKDLEGRKPDPIPRGKGGILQFPIPVRPVPIPLPPRGGVVPGNVVPDAPAEKRK